MSHKIPKINETIKFVIGQAIQEEYGMAYGLISITKVDTSPDIKSARIYISCYGTTEEEKLIDRLNAQAGEFQAIINDQVRLKYTPKLTFILDDTLEHADRIEKLLKQ